MSDTSVLLFINGLSGRITAVDEFFKGVSNDYFPLVLASLVLVWLWFSSRESRGWEDRRGVMIAVISIAVVSGLVELSNSLYFRPRPFEALPWGSLNLLFYRPTDSSFPSNLAAVAFAIAVSVFIKNRTYGTALLSLAVLSGFGRVYIGVHYPLDVVAGAAIGAVASFISFGIERLLRPFTDSTLGLLRRHSLA